MATVVGVHGIGQQLQGERSLLKSWVPALQDGMSLAGYQPVKDDQVAMAFYGDLFRPAGSTLAVGEPLYTAADVDSDIEVELLLQWWKEASRIDDRVVAPDARTLLRTPRSVQAGLLALGHSAFFAGIALRALVFDLKQVRIYLTDDGLRQEVQARIASSVNDDTRVIVAHSLGSVAAYEALCQHPQWPVTTLVTLGSPLGIPNLIFHRLRPGPSDGVARWPQGLGSWTNIADSGDVVALVKDLRPQFGDRVRCQMVHNGAHAHDCTNYLRAKQTGAAIGSALHG
jgi:pimeloyl-ACP methyl ester carboxylesterase